MSRRGLALGVTLVALALPGSASAFGTFGAAANLGVGDRPQDVIAGHFNDDATIDLLVAVFGDSQLNFLKGTGDGTFTPAPYAAATPVALAAGDLDGDGDKDAVMANGPNESVGVMLNDGSGVFAPPGLRTLAGYASEVVLARINGDRKLDAAVTAGGRVAVLLGRGNGSLRAPRYTNAGTNPNGMAAADLDRDGNVDLAVNDTLSGKVLVLRGRGNGRFRRPRSYNGGADTSQFVAIADFNGDRRKDLAVTHYGDTDVGILLGKRTGFRRVRNYPTDGPTLGLTVNDLNGDGRKDIAVANASGVEVLRGRRRGAFAASDFYSTGTFAQTVAAGRFNDDPGVDLAVVNFGDDNVSILSNEP